MADVSHELGSLRHIVGSPLSSKVAMFNQVADQHNSSQLLNPFSNVRGSSPGRPVFSKDEYGKPLAGSLTEMRGQKANIHVCKEMLELCEIICSEGFSHPDNEDIKVIFFGDLFNIYNHISDKCVGLLLRARKHKLVEFEGEILFQRRDDEVPIITTKPLPEIRQYIANKTEEFRRSVSPAPKATTVIIDNMRRAVSQTPSTSPFASKAGTPRSMSPQPNGSNDITQPMNQLCKPQPLRQAHSTPEININLIENDVKKEVKNVLNGKPPQQPSSQQQQQQPEEKTKEGKNKIVKNSDQSNPAKVAVFLIRAPVVATSIIEETEDVLNEINKENNIKNQETKLEESNKSNPKVNSTVNNTIESSKAESKEVKVSDADASNNNNNNKSIESKPSDDDKSKNADVKPQADPIKTEILNNNSENQKNGVTITIENNNTIENTNTSGIVVTTNPEAESSPQEAKSEEISEQKHNESAEKVNETIESPKQSLPEGK